MLQAVDGWESEAVGPHTVVETSAAPDLDADGKRNSLVRLQGWYVGFSEQAAPESPGAMKEWERTFVVGNGGRTAAMLLEWTRDLESVSFECVSGFFVSADGGTVARVETFTMFADDRRPANPELANGTGVTFGLQDIALAGGVRRVVAEVVDDYSNLTDPDRRSLLLSRPRPCKDSRFYVRQDPNP